MKKFRFAFLAVLLGVFGLLASCSDANASIKVYTRDTTSGTRDGFFTTIGFSEAKEDNEPLVEGYVEVASNGDMISAIKNDEYGIGYISLASLSTAGVTGLSFEGVAPTEANVLNSTYELTRNFNYITRSEYATTKEEQICEAFIAYLSTSDAKSTIQSKDGILAIASTDPTWDSIKANYPVCSEDNSAVTIKFGGSTSVEKIAKALSAEFALKCGNFVPEHNHTGSGDAYKRTQGTEKDGADFLNIAFASREFKADTEAAAANTSGKICIDAIVAVVNTANKKVTNVTAKELVEMYDGTITLWSELE